MSTSLLLRPAKALPASGASYMASARALVYTGTRQLTYSENALHLYVNGKRGAMWVIHIVLSPRDTYTVSLTSERNAQKRVLASRDDVYCDELQAVVEQMYDDAIKTYNHGFIPLD